MATRIKDGMIPYTGGIGIEITNNHVINVLLRELNNLIHVNEDRELYVDLQLDDGIQPDDDFPVGVTTGKILQEDGWQQSGIILNWKTTSGDYVRFIYANDGKLYYDPGTGVWIEIGAGGGATLDINTKTFWISNTDDLQTATQALQWRLQGKFPVISYQGNTYLLDREFSEGDSGNLRFINTFTTIYEDHSTGTSHVGQNRLYIFYTDGEATRIGIDTVAISPNVLDTSTDYQTPYTPQYDGSPATTLALGCYLDMFNSCPLTALPQLPATTLAKECYLQMFDRCFSIKLSETQIGEYQTPYRIPTNGTGTEGADSLCDMFRITGGTFTGTPDINRTYYTSNTVI